jgi:hypothetical protein
MSLALVTIDVDQFDLVYQHLVHGKRKYRNMHMREACQRNGVRDLRYLHAMYAPETVPAQILGMISGPGVFWQYRITLGRRGTHVAVPIQRANPSDRARILRRFVTEINNRIQDEESGEIHFPKRSSGQYYLRRSKPGMDANHPNCIAAVQDGVLDARFVAQLSSWNLELLHP